MAEKIYSYCLDIILIDCMTDYMNLGEQLASVEQYD